VHEIKRFWDRIRTEAGIVDVRIHDLRHTFASLLVSGGMSLPMIGRLLGHTQVQTTQRYAHLFDDPLRAGLQQVDQLMRPKLKLVDTARAAERTPSFGVWGSSRRFRRRAVIAALFLCGMHRDHGSGRMRSLKVASSSINERCR